jgi:hypothetical protein
MSKNKELFKDAIVEARTIKNVAIANAKAALEESLSPHLQKMFAVKLQEIESEDTLDEANDTLEEELDLDEILAEIEAEDKEMCEVEDETEVEDEVEPDTEMEDDLEGPDMDADMDDRLVSDLSVDDLKAIISGVISAQLGNESTEMDTEMNMDDMAGDMGNEDAAIGGEEEIDLDELLAELELEEGTEEEVYEAKDKELEEAIKTIKILRSDLNEVNLLNAKLLYVNKIYKANNLSESQKMAVLETLDKAESVKEAKLVYESLVVSLKQNKKTSNSKQAIKENLGFASKPSGVVKRQAIIEEDPMVARFAKLANIK